jgi:hypothetical protein
MADHATKPAQNKSRTRGDQPTQNPAEIARRDLVAWCQAHQLPVPEDRSGAQSNGR